MCVIFQSCSATRSIDDNRIQTALVNISLPGTRACHHMLMGAITFIDMMGKTATAAGQVAYHHLYPQSREQAQGCSIDLRGNGALGAALQQDNALLNRFFRGKYLIDCPYFIYPAQFFRGRAQHGSYSARHYRGKGAPQPGQL